MSKDPHRFDPSPRKGEMTDTDKLIAKLEAENAKLRMDIVDNGSAKIFKQIVVYAEECAARKMAQVVCDECKRCQDAGEAQAIGLEELMQLWREGRGK